MPAAVVCRPPNLLWTAGSPETAVDDDGSAQISLLPGDHSRCQHETCEKHKQGLKVLWKCCRRWYASHIHDQIKMKSDRIYSFENTCAGHPGPDLWPTGWLKKFSPCARTTSAGPEHATMPRCGYIRCAFRIQQHHGRDILFSRLRRARKSPRGNRFSPGRSNIHRYFRFWHALEYDLHFCGKRDVPFPAAAQTAVDERWRGFRVPLAQPRDRESPLGDPYLAPSGNMDVCCGKSAELREEVLVTAERA